MWKFALLMTTLNGDVERLVIRAPSWGDAFDYARQFSGAGRYRLVWIYPKK